MSKYHRQRFMWGNRWQSVRRAVFERDNYCCVICDRAAGRLECDHIKPLSEGGDNKTVRGLYGQPYVMLALASGRRNFSGNVVYRINNTSAPGVAPSGTVI